MLHGFVGNSFATIKSRRRYPRHFIVFLLLVSNIAACGRDSDRVPVVPATDTPTPPPGAVIDGYDQPLVSFTDTQVLIEEKQDSLQKKIALINAGAEQAVVSGQIDSTAQADGFSATGDCYNRSTELAASSGNWRFELGFDCTLMQFSETVLEPGYAVALTFDAQSSSPGAGLTAEVIVMQDDGTAHTLSSRDVMFTDSTVLWQTVQVMVDYDQHDQLAGGVLGVRFVNLITETAVSLDNIELSLYQPAIETSTVFDNTWGQHCDQLWAGQYFWSNRLQDWRVHNGRLETRDANQYRPNRTTHRVTTKMSKAPADFSLTVDTGLVSDSGAGAYSGFLLGAGSRMDYRSAALVHNRHGHNGGIIVGVDDTGRVFVLDHGINKRRLVNGVASEAASRDGVTLRLDAKFQSNGQYVLDVYAIDSTDTILSSATVNVDPEKLLGNIALVSNPGSKSVAHWFDNWTGFGAKLREMPSRQFGPVLFASYTVSRETLTLNAQYPPMCSDAMTPPVLQVFKDGTWAEVANASIDPQSHTAKFRVENWNSDAVVHYRVETQMQSQGAQEPNYFHGAIQANPVNNSEFVIGVFNCRPGLINSEVEGWIQQNNSMPFTWTRDRIVFPHEELLENSQQHAMDLVVFLGDQLYEFDPNGFIDKRPEHLVNDYLWKWYIFGWSAKEIMRNTPVFMLPDDHDIYQGNIWGEGGIAAEVQEDGGYVNPASFINIVQRTQTGSLPPPYSTDPLAQGITTYYTDLVYGGVGIAVVEDRKFKTGPNSAQRPLQLLGAQQVAFLEKWAGEWQDQSMKVVISQSPFSQSTTHSGKNFSLIKRDLDSNGWPKTGRDEAVRLLRKAFAPHIAGDQHLGMTLKHGIDLPGDSVYSFAGPSMLNIFPRIWDPLNLEDGPGDKQNDYLGQHTDVHGNLITVLAAANPEVYYRQSPAPDMPSKNDLGIGYGVVRVNKPARQYTFEAWPANVDPSEHDAETYPQWPITVDQIENDGRIPSGYLTPRIAAVAHPVVQVFTESNNALLYARRYPTTQIELPIYDSEASYRVVLSDPGTDYREQFDGQRAQ